MPLATLQTCPRTTWLYPISLTVAGRCAVIVKLLGLSSVGLSRLRCIQVYPRCLELRFGKVTDSDGSESVYLGITKGIRRRRVSTHEARTIASVHQTDVIRTVPGSMRALANCPYPGRRTAVGAESRFVIAIGNPAAGRAARSHGEARTVRLDEAHSPVAGSYSTVGPELPLSHGVSTDQDPRLPQNGNWPLRVRRFRVVQSGS
jgi:hypothetical protein